MKTGDRIKELRKEKGLTQKKLSELTGIPVITIQGYESGSYNPKFNKIRLLARELDVSEDYLMGFTSVKARNPDRLIDANKNDILRSLETMTNDELDKLELDLNRMNLELIAQSLVDANTEINRKAKNKYSDLDHLQLQLLMSFDDLNYLGQKQAIDQLLMLSEIPKFQKRNITNPSDQVSRDE